MEFRNFLNIYQREPVDIYFSEVIQTSVVSVCIQTYQHVNYIAQCLDSILMQKTIFPIEILLGEDASTDGTRDICIEYAKKHPDKIRLFLHKRENNIEIGGSPTGRFNFMYNLYSAKGKYIAFCEGDDYWTDPLKLQKQVDFLEVNEDVSIVHTDFDWLDDNTQNITPNFYAHNQIKFKKKYDVKEWFMNPKGRTLTFCFRKKDLDGYAEIINPKWTVGDTVLILHLAKNKYIGYINESTGVYRRNEGSASALTDTKKKFYYFKNGSIAVKRFFYEYYSLDNKKIEKKIETDYFEELFKLTLPAKKYTLFFKSLWYKIRHLKISISDFKYLAILLFSKKKLRK